MNKATGMWKWKLPGGWTWAKVNAQLREDRQKKAFVGKLKKGRYYTDGSRTTGGGPR